MKKKSAKEMKRELLQIRSQSGDMSKRIEELSAQIQASRAKQASTKGAIERIMTFLSQVYNHANLGNLAEGADPMCHPQQPGGARQPAAKSGSPQASSGVGRRWHSARLKNLAVAQRTWLSSSKVSSQGRGGAGVGHGRPGPGLQATRHPRGSLDHRARWQLTSAAPS